MNTSQSQMKLFKKSPFAAITKTDSDQQSTDSKSKIVRQPLRIPTQKKIQIQKQLHTPSLSKDAWIQMFGSFLHDINLKQKKQEHKGDDEKFLQDPLVANPPLLMSCSSKQFKLEFYKYLEGEQTIEQLMDCINFPSLQLRQLHQKQEEEKKKGFAKKIQQFRISMLNKRGSSPLSTPKEEKMTLSDKVKVQQIRLLEQRRVTEAHKLQEQLKFRLQRKLQVLRDFIASKIDVRKRENLKQREEEIRNIHFIKTFFDIASDYNQNRKNKADELQEETTYYKKKMPIERRLKQMLVKFDNVKPTVKHQEKHLDLYEPSTKPMMMNLMKIHSKDYLQELEKEKEDRYKDALRQVHKLLQAQNIKFRSNSNSPSPMVEKKSKSRFPSPNNKQQELQLESMQKIDVLVASPKNNRRKQVALSTFKDGIIERSKRKEYVITKKPFYLFTKRATKEKNSKHSKGLITMYDLKLYDYIHNSKIYSSNNQLRGLSQKFNTLIENDIQQQDNENLNQQYQSRKYLNQQIKKRFFVSSQFQKTEPQQGQEYESHDDSLQSIYEVTVDNLYAQARNLGNKLNSKNDGGFAKRLKQLMKLEEVNTQSVQTNLQKLCKTHI